MFTAAEGGAEHIGLDHLPYVSEYIADWVADTFAELDAAGLSGDTISTGQGIFQA